VRHGRDEVLCPFLINPLLGIAMAQYHGLSMMLRSKRVR